MPAQDRHVLRHPWRSSLGTGTPAQLPPRCPRPAGPLLWVGGEEHDALEGFWQRGSLPALPAGRQLLPLKQSSRRRPPPCPSPATKPQGAIAGCSLQTWLFWAQWRKALEQGLPPPSPRVLPQAGGKEGWALTRGSWGTASWLQPSPCARLCGRLPSTPDRANHA